MKAPTKILGEAMIRNHIVAGAAALAAAALPASAAQAEAAWRPLFDGKTLEGWTPKIAGYPAGENYLQTFVVRDGAITQLFDPPPSGITSSRAFRSS